MKGKRKPLSTVGKIEQIAREQYRLVNPGEEAYIVSGRESTVPTTTPYLLSPTFTIQSICPT